MGYNIIGDVEIDFEDVLNCGEMPHIPLDAMCVGLWRQKRFCGQTTNKKRSWSVMEHSIMIHEMLPLMSDEFTICEDDRCMALLHDASESIICDIPSNLKVLLPEYKKIEKVVMDSIKKRFDLEHYPDDRYLSLIKRLDLVALYAESQYFDVNPDSNEWAQLKSTIHLMDYEYNEAISIIKNIQLDSKQNLMKDFVNLLSNTFNGEKDEFETKTTT